MAKELQIVGMTSDAASLIRLIEQSPHFAHAIFFAPTTRSPGTTKEQFHIRIAHQPDIHVRLMKTIRAYLARFPIVAALAT